MDWNEHCCLLSSPSACVSPSDPTLTVENVREVMAEVRNWRRVGSWLGVPYSKQLKIIKQSSTEREKSLALGDYWVNTPLMPPGRDLPGSFTIRERREH